MIRRLGVFVAGMFWGFLVEAGLAWALLVRSGYSFYSLYAIEALTGILIGLFVGFADVGNADILAVMCLSPMSIFEVSAWVSRNPAAFTLWLLLLSIALKLSLAFLIATFFSKRRRDHANTSTKNDASQVVARQNG